MSILIVLRHLYRALVNDPDQMLYRALINALYISKQAVIYIYIYIYDSSARPQTMFWLAIIHMIMYDGGGTDEES